MSQDGDRCPCEFGPWDVLLEFDAGHVYLVHEACGLEIDLDPEELASAPLPLRLEVNGPGDVNNWSPETTWFELSLRPPTDSP